MHVRLTQNDVETLANELAFQLAASMLFSRGTRGVNT